MDKTTVPKFISIVFNMLINKDLTHILRKLL